jgi:hypothetical protein
MWRNGRRNGLKIRWAVIGPCRFESGHRQFRCAWAATKTVTTSALPSISGETRSGANDRGLAILLAASAAVLVIHLLTGGRYGFHRDELATLDDATHLAWGYVVYPPVPPFFGWISLKLFGTSLTGFRFFAAVATSVAVVFTGLMARELGGKSGAQAIAAAAAIPFATGAGTLMQYVAFDYLAWVACACFFVLLCKSRDPRWCLAVGACIGFGMVTVHRDIFICRHLHESWPEFWKNFRRYG